MCGSMVDIQSATRLRLGEERKEEEEQKLQDENIMSASATQGGHKKSKMAQAGLGPWPFTSQAGMLNC